MKPMLTRADVSIFHYIDGVRVDGAHARISGDVSGLSGDVTDLSGDVTGLTGNVDDCGLTDDERARGVDINDLVMNLPRVAAVD